MPSPLALSRCFFVFIALASTQASDTRWWPEQKTPKTLLIIDSGQFSKLGAAHAGRIPEESSRSPYHMLAESLSGLAAQAVNEGQGDELIWVAMRGNKSYAEWLERLVKRTGVTKKKSTDLWTTVSDYAKRGIVKGYILYNHELVTRDERKEAIAANESANAATVMAGLLGGVVVDENLQAEAEKAGLKMLLDARKLTEAEVFQQNKDKLNRHYMLLQTPELAFGRDLAIAHRMMVVFGRETPTPEAYDWLEPIGTVYGWNLDPEDKAVGQISEAGHVIVPCDWAPNLAALSCGAPASLKGLDGPKFKTPAAVPVKEDQSVIGALMSDGDNLQWALTTFGHNPKYWGHPLRNEFPLGWGLPIGDLLQVSPDAYNFYVETQGDKTSVMPHLGYYYPDTFGKLRGPEQRAELLKRLAHRLEYTLKASGTSLFTFLVKDINGTEAKQAYQIFADEAPSLKAMFAIQYHPYEGGEGEVMWFPRKSGGEVPVTSAAWAIWKASEKRKRGLVPTKLAARLSEEAEAAKKPFSDWLIIHAWSEFPEEVADMPNAFSQGVDPTLKFFRQVNATVPVVTLEQIVSRLQAERKSATP